MNASIFKTCSSLTDIYKFLGEKGFLGQERTDVLQEHLEGKEHKHFEITSDGGLLAVIVYKDNDELRDAEKEFKENISVNYIILVKGDYSEYRFYKYDEGTGKTLRLRKKKEEFESVFIKKLESLKYDDLAGFEKIFDRSEFIKEFYQLYCDAEDYLTKNVSGISEEKDKEFFAKLTIERVMFLWFLQKKGFLDSNEHYFVDRFKLIKTENKNYYKDFLKKLFFNGLCKKPNERENSVKTLVGDVPYLNGGLFIESEIELKYGNSIEIGNKVFFRVMDYAKINSEKNIPVINLMECKEWTIDERSGEVDKLNPEVLGYIFEKSINQKDLGAVYTPEEITTYICKNTIYPYIFDKINEKFDTKHEYKGDIKKDLLEHLNKEQLKELFSIVKTLRILDPAVGSGHFLVDAILTLEKIYYHLYEKDIIGWSKFEIREYVIKENLFGVDILPGAIEICKLRMFLSLAETFETKQDIHPLPNIEFNFRAGNSLIGFVSKSELKQNFMSGGSAINAITKNIAFLKKHYPEIAKKAEKIVANLFNMNTMDLFNIRNELVHDYRTPKDNKEFHIELREVINELTRAFNDELNNQFFKNIKLIFDKDKSLDEEFIQLIKKNKNGKVPSKEKLIFEKFLDLTPFHWLMEFSEVVCSGGFDVVIGNPPYIELRTINSVFRNFLYSTSDVASKKTDIYAFFFERSINLIKKSAMLGYITSNTWLMQESFLQLRLKLLTNTQIQKIIQTPDNTFKGVNVSTVIIIFQKCISQEKIAHQNIEYFEIKETVSNKPTLKNVVPQINFIKEPTHIFNLKYSQNLDGIFKKIISNSVPLSKITYVDFGCVTGDNDKFVKRIKSSELDKLVLNGKDIERYNFKWSGDYVHYDAQKMIKNNPVARPGDKERFECNEKLILQRHSGTRIVGAIDTEKYYGLISTVIVRKKENVKIPLKYLLGVLNSKMITFWSKFVLTTASRSIRVFRNIPIKITKEDNMERIVQLVSKIMECNKIINKGSKKDNIQELIKEINNISDKIDSEVYSIYNLDDSEIDIVEKSIR